MFKRLALLVFVCLGAVLSTGCACNDDACVILAPCPANVRALVYYERCNGTSGYKEVWVTPGGHILVRDYCRRITDVICNSDWA